MLLTEKFGLVKLVWQILNCFKSNCTAVVYLYQRKGFQQSCVHSLVPTDFVILSTFVCCLLFTPVYRLEILFIKWCQIERVCAFNSQSHHLWFNVLRGEKFCIPFCYSENLNMCRLLNLIEITIYFHLLNVLHSSI